MGWTEEREEVDPGARWREADYKRRSGAVAPVFETDAKGLVIMECWAAPPEMWTSAQAIALGKELLPPGLKKVEPKPQRRDGSKQMFLWADGTSVVLTAFRDRYIQVEARSASYQGPGC